EMNRRLTARFHAGVGNRLVWPVNVLGYQRSHIGLRTAQVPEQFVVGFEFHIAFTGNNGPMLLPSDGAFFLEVDLWPLTFGNHRPWEPGHVQGEVVETP